MRSERSPLPISDLRVAASFAARSLRSLSRRRAASTASAFALFRCCERSSWHSTTMPVGRCVMRTAESVLLTCWPPAPLARKVSIRRSAGFSTTSATSSASGSTATVHAVVWMRPCALGLRHALHAMPARLELELRVDAVAFDAQHHFLVAADLGRAFADDLAAPAAAFAVAQIHARQVAGEQRRFVAAGAGADLQEGVARVVRVARQQPGLQIGQQGLQVGLGRGDFVARQFAEFGVIEHRAAFGQVALAPFVLAELLHHLRDFGLLTRQAAVVGHVRQHLRIGQVRVQFGQTQSKPFELFA